MSKNRDEFRFSRTEIGKGSGRIPDGERTRLPAIFLGDLPYQQVCPIEGCRRILRDDGEVVSCPDHGAVLPEVIDLMEASR